MCVALEFRGVETVALVGIWVASSRSRRHAKQRLVAGKDIGAPHEGPSNAQVSERFRAPNMRKKIPVSRGFHNTPYFPPSSTSFSSQVTKVMNPRGFLFGEISSLPFALPHVSRARLHSQGRGNLGVCPLM